MPLTIRTFECSTKPVAAAASPVNAFSSEITTGMSAPPIGSTNTTPKTAQRRRSAATSSQLARRPPSPRRRAQSSRRRASAFPTCWPGNVIGRPLISSCSFPNATIEPANEIEPTSAENTIDDPRSTPTSPLSARPCGTRRARSSAAAPPPTPLNSATICGIAVIFTLRAPTTPDRRADRHSGGDPPVAGHDLLERERDDDRDRASRRRRSGCRAARAAGTRGSAARG